MNKDRQDTQDGAVFDFFLVCILPILSILVLWFFLPLEYTSPNPAVKWETPAKWASISANDLLPRKNFTAMGDLAFDRPLSIR